MAINKNFYYESNLAYKSNLDYKETKQTRKNHIGKVKKRKVAIIKPLPYILLLTIASFVLSFYIANLSKVNELNAKISTLKKQFEIQKSEEIRYRSFLETNVFNPTKIELYAKTHLNMRKTNHNQINYISVPRKNFVAVNSLQNEKSKKNPLKRAKNFLKGIFG